MKLVGKLKTYPSYMIERSNVSIGFECLDREMFNPEKCYDLLGKSGVKYARCQTGWARCEKKKGIYDFKWLDDIVDNLISVGVQPWFNVGYGNPIYMPDASTDAAVGCAPILYGKDVIKAWESYIRALSIHFRGRVEYFEIWNEPDIGQFWYPGNPNGEQYAKLVSLTGSVIRSEVSGAKIGTSISSCWGFDFTVALVEALVPGEIDFFCYHAYSRVPEESYLKNINEYKSILKNHGMDSVELWQGEAGFPSWFPKNHWLNPYGSGNEHQQAVWQLRRFFLDAVAGVKKSSFFQMADMMERPYDKARETLSSPARHGILNGITYTPKKSYETISRLAVVLSGNITVSDNYFVGALSERNPLLRMSLIYMSLEKDGKPMYVYYLPTDIEEEMPKEYDFTAYIDGSTITNPVIIDMLSGDIYDAEENKKGGTSYIMSISGLSAREYPMMICDRSLFEIE